MRPHALAKLVRSDGTIDWSPWYLTEEEDMGQSGEQGRIIDILRSSLRVLIEEREWSSVMVATDNFFAWVPGQPLVQVSPDIYLVDYPGRERETSGDSQPPSRSLAYRMPDDVLPRRWETWRSEHLPPRLAIEIVSQDWKKDYDINPDRYDHLGVRELVLIDPEAFVRDRSSAGRAPLVIFRRAASDRLERVYHGRGPAPCVEIDAFLIFEANSAGAAWVRISRDEAGTDIVPTTDERIAAAEQRAAAAEQEIAAAKQEIAAAKQETAAAKQETAAAKQEAAALAAEIAEIRARLHDAEQE